MKRLITYLSLVGMAVAGYAAEPMPADFDYTSVTTYFNACLQSQENANYTPGIYDAAQYAIPLSDVDAMTARIWDEWKKVNNKYTNTDRKEDRIRTNMEPFPRGGEFVIPQSLEPYVYESSDPNKYTAGTAKMLYAIGYKPTSASGKAPYPLLIHLHGSGEASYEYSTNQNVVAGFNDNDAPAIYIVPRIPNGSDGYYRWYQKSKQWVWEKIFRQCMLRDDIDKDRMYFMGISEGAYGSQRLGSFYADYIGGAGPIAGGEPLINAPCENLYNTYFNLTTGSADTGYGRNDFTQYAGETLDALQQQYPDGYVHDVIIRPGEDHSLNHGTGYNYTSPELKKHARVTNPKHVRWENFAMDGRFRTGFYNLKMIQRSEGPTNYELRWPDGEVLRTYYEMDIDDDNNIDMTVSVVRIVCTQWYYSQLASRIKKTYTPATQGRFKVYLNNELVDLSKPVKLTVNGREVFNGTLQPNLADMVNSCAEYYDPARVYPASIEVNLADMTGSGLQSGIEDIVVDETMSDADAEPEFYTLQGVRVSNPSTPGLYIRRQGQKTTKIIIR